MSVTTTSGRSVATAVANSVQVAVRRDEVEILDRLEHADDSLAREIVVLGEDDPNRHRRRLSLRDVDRPATRALVPAHPERVVRRALVRASTDLAYSLACRARAPAEREPAPSNVVEAKVRVPLPAALGGVAAPLVNRLRTASASLVILTAPAGYGKTTLAAQWAERERRPVAWLSVDEADDDAARLLAQIAAALDRLERQADKPAARRRKEWTDELARLAARLRVERGLRARGRRRPSPPLPQRDEGIGDAGRADPGRVGAGAGRRDTRPRLPIARLRADGRLLELQAGELALSRREGEALLRGLDAGLAADDADDLLERCEGWAAGIRLGALASSRR